MKPHPRFTLFLILLLAVVFSSVCVKWSSKRGRLHNPPNYDDVVYLASGADLLHTLHTEGVGGLGRYIERDRLHSPYSTAMAALAFSFTGLNIAAPYRLNTVLIAAYLAGIAYYFRKTQRPVLTLALIYFLIPPFAMMAVVEFRPDLAWATVIGFSAVFAVTRDDLFHNWKAAVVPGVGLGLALLIKPSTFAMTFVVAAMALGAAWIIEAARNGARNAARRLPFALVMVGGPVLLLAGPYYAVFGKDVWQYFMENSFGVNAPIWTHQGDWTHQWLFYIWGDGCLCNLARQSFPIFAAWIALAVYHFRGTSATLRLKTFFMALMIAVVFAINSHAPMKSPFLGGAFYGMLLFSLAFLAGEFFSQIHSSTPRVRHSALVGLGALVVFGLITYRVSAYSRWSRTPQHTAFTVAYQGMAELAKTCKTPSSILFMQSGPLVSEDVELLYFRRKEAPRIYSGAFYRNLAEFQKALPGLDMVVLQDKGTLGGFDALPVEPLLEDCLQTIRANPHFQVAKTIPIPNPEGQSRNVYLFVRTEPDEKTIEK
jgi:hypothetical protein